MPYRYRLTQSLLKLSTHSYIKEVAEQKFIIRSNDAKTINHSTREGERELLLAPAIFQLVADTGRGWTLNDVDFSRALHHGKNASIKANALNTAIKNIFPSDVARLLLQGHCQNPTYLIGGTALSIGDIKDQKNPVSFTVAQSEKDLKVNIYSRENKGFICAEVNKYRVLDEKNGDDLALNNHHAMVTCVATKKGYEFCEEYTDNMVVYDISMGVVPDSLEWFKKRDKNFWTWSEKNLRVFEPIFPDSYVEPYQHRLKNAFHKIFNGNPYRSDAAAFFAWPDNGYNPLRQLVFYLLSGEFLNLFKNTVKLCTEFLPAMVEEAGSYTLDTGKKYLSDPANRTWSMNTVSAAANVVVGAFLYGIGKIIRQITMRVTSPMRALNEAYEFGEKAQGKALGYTLATLSALVSLAAIAAVGIFAGIALAPIIGVKMVVGLFTTFGAIQPMITTMVNKDQTKALGDNTKKAEQQVMQTCILTPAPDNKPKNNSLLQRVFGSSNDQKKTASTPQAAAPAPSHSAWSSIGSWFSFGKSAELPQKPVIISRTPTLDKLKCKS